MKKKCVGYPDCDGMLPGEEHEIGCPLVGTFGPPEEPLAVCPEGHILTPADYDRIAKHLMELSKAAEEARVARELAENNSISVAFSVADWLTDRQNFLQSVGVLIDILLNEESRRSTGTFTVELRVPKV